MKAFKLEKILIPIDFSETSLLAIEHAGFIAQLFKAELVLLHVVEKYWEQFSVIQPELMVPVPNDFENAVANKLEETAANILKKYGVKSTCITSEGNVFSEILSISKEQQVDLVVMGTHGTSGIVEFFIGSNTYRVVTQSECPILSVQGHSKKLGFTDILLPIDDSAHSRQKINHAIIIAKQFASKIHIVGLPDTTDASDLKKFEIKLDQIEEFVKKSGLSYSRKTLNGTNQARLTEEYAKTVNADLIVIMTDQDEDITGRLMGTFAQQIINHSKIPVLSVQPVVGYVEFPSLSGGYHAG